MKKTILVIVISLIVGLMLIHFYMDEYYRIIIPEQIPFNSEVWKSEKLTKESIVRAKMQNDLIGKYINHSTNRDQVIALLGQPEITNKCEFKIMRSSKEPIRLTNDEGKSLLIDTIIVNNLAENVSDYYFLNRDLSLIKFKYHYLNLDYKGDSLIMISVITDMDYFK